MNRSAPLATYGGFTVAKVGLYLYGLATLGAGVLDLIWGEFEGAHQPIQALGGHIPGQLYLAYFTAICMILAGAAVLWRRTARAGALASALIYLMFSLFWLPRFYTVPRVLGFHLPVFVGLLGGMFMQLIVAAGGIIVYAASAPAASFWGRRSATAARWIFGSGSVLFGLRHLTAIDAPAELVAHWMPFGGVFWATLSGIAFVAAGLAILSRVLNVWATRLLVLMVLIFEVPVLIPLVMAHPHNHIAWGANAYNLAAAGAIAIFAASVSTGSLAVGNCAMALE